MKAHTAVQGIPPLVGKHPDFPAIQHKLRFPDTVAHPADQSPEMRRHHHGIRIKICHRVSIAHGHIDHAAIFRRNQQITDHSAKITDSGNHTISGKGIKPGFPLRHLHKKFAVSHFQLLHQPLRTLSRLAAFLKDNAPVGQASTHAPQSAQAAGNP